MALSTEAMILAAFLDHLAEFVFDPPLPIAYPGVDFAGDVVPKNYLIADMAFNPTRQLTIGDDPQQRRGIFQVTVVWESGVGLIKPLDVAGGIVNHFSNRLLWAGETRILIDREPSLASPIQQDNRVAIPISINWHAFEPEV